MSELSAFDFLDWTKEDEAKFQADEKAAAKALAKKRKRESSKLRQRWASFIFFFRFRYKRQLLLDRIQKLENRAQAEYNELRRLEGFQRSYGKRLDALEYETGLVDPKAPHKVTVERRVDTDVTKRVEAITDERHTAPVGITKAEAPVYGTWREAAAAITGTDAL